MASECQVWTSPQGSPPPAQEEELSLEDPITWSWLTGVPSMHLWD